MKAIRFLSAALLAAAFVGCSQEEQFDMLQEAQMEFTGSFEQVGSRVTMDENNMMNWEANKDMVSIFPGITVNNSYQVSSVTNGKATFKFVDYVDPTDGYSKTTGNYNYAVYPYADGNSITADGTITASVPASFDYDGMENSIQTALMVAKSSNGSLSFKNVQGILRLRLNAQQPLNYGAVASIKLESAANPLSGAVTITFGEDGLPVADLASEGGKTLTLNLAEALQTALPKAANSEYAEFYIPIVPTEFAANDVTMTITWKDTEIAAYKKVVTIPFSIERRKIYTLHHTIGASADFDGEIEGAEVVWDGVTATTPQQKTDGEGNTYYEVGSASDLAGLAALVNGTSTATYARSAASYNFKLTADIDLGGHEWTPIGNGSRSGSGVSGNAYTGVFDGQGFTIKGLTITSGSGNAAVGLIGVLNGGTIKNVNFTDVNINAPSSELTGAAAGFVTGGGIVDNVTVAGEITASKGVGGIVGRATINAQILNSVNNATINATSGNAGGIVGAAYYTSAGNVYTGSNAALVIDNCTNNGAVTTSSGGYTGGIVGLSAVRVNNCTNSGAVEAKGTSVGGIVGEQKESGEVIGCTNNGTVTNNDAAYGTGGIIGWLRYPASEAGTGKAYEVQNIVNVTDNTNNATINGGSDAGGIVGTVYNYAVVTGNKNYAPELKASIFAAGIVANVQFDATNANNMVSGEAWKVAITGNHSTTGLAEMTVGGTCKSPIAYDNSQGAHTEIANNTTGPITVKSSNDLKIALTTAGAAGAGNTTISFAGDLDMSSVSWSPITVDGYNGADIVTVEGNNNTISGLKAPLFAGGFAGGSGIVIKDLTINQSTIVSSNTLGSGAFIESSDSQAKIELINCKLTNSSVSGSRTGGLVGWTSGYNNENDGPVKSYITFTNCVVDNCTITGSSVGGINGHAGANAWTYTTIENCTVTNCNLNSTDDGDWRVGVAVGTANVGEVTITNLTESKNTLTQTDKTAPTGEKRNYFGRLVPGTTGKLVIDGETITNE